MLGFALTVGVMETAGVSLVLTTLALAAVLAALFGLCLVGADAAIHVRR